MIMQPVESTTIASIGYDSTSGVLRIEFINKSGTALYEYYGVPDQTFEGLMSADSHGRYFAANIKGKYEYARI